MIFTNKNAPAKWTFLTNHAHVFLLLSKYPSLKIKELAEKVNITERAILKILSELKEEGYIVVEKNGRRNKYKLCKNKHLKHPIEKQNQISALIELLIHIDNIEKNNR